MPGLGEGFVNVKADDRASPAIVWARGNGVADDREGIQNAIWSLTNPAISFRGGTIYFPPGIYRIGRDPRRLASRPNGEFAGVHEDIHVPNDVRLSFAPGASLHLDLDAVINIEGLIDAGPQKIFETPETRRSSLNDRVLSAPINNVFFTGQRIVEIFPEWWGAGSLPPQRRTQNPSQQSILKAFRDTFALQAALNAACNNRQWNPVTGLLTGAQPIRVPLAIRLIGQYFLLAPLRVGASVDGFGSAAPNPQGLILRGDGNMASAAALIWCNELDFPNQALAMLELRGVFGAEISNVTFEAQPSGASLARRAKRCLFLDANVNGDRFATGIVGAAQGTLLRRCTFRNATEALVQVGPPLPPSPTDLRWQEYPYRLSVDNLQRDSGAHDLLNLSFEQCDFQAGGANRANSIQNYPYLSYQSDGVVLRASNSLCVRFDGGTFGGPVRAMIRAFGGTFSLTGCSFHSKLIHRDGTAISEPRDRGMQVADDDIERGNGVDIFLMRPPAEVNLDAPTDRDAMGRDTRIIPTFPIPTAGFSAVQCDSQSYQFLKTHKSMNDGGIPTILQ